MYIKREIDFNYLKENSWSGAISTLETIEEFNKEDELMYLIEEVFIENVPTETELNDFLWFDTEFIFESLCIEGEEE